jgi:hypothetical protein
MSFETNQWLGSRNLGLAGHLARVSHVPSLYDSKEGDAIGRWYVVFTGSEGWRD